MATARALPDDTREPQLLGQTVVVIGGSGGIGLEVARRARTEGADVILTGHNAEQDAPCCARGRGAEHSGVRRQRRGHPGALLLRACRSPSTT